jgi:hypothetical protein
MSNGYSDDRGMFGLPVGSSEEGDLHLVMDANVFEPIHSFYLFILFVFLSRD